MDSYLLSTHFAGRICDECLTDFSHAKVAVYRYDESECPSTPNLKQAFAQLKDEELANMQGRLLAQGETDDNGHLRLVIDSSKTKYEGGCIEVVVTFTRRFGSDKELAQPEHFRIARYQPNWDPSETAYVHYGDFIIPTNLWCAYLRRHDIWVICGKVTTCDKPGSPIGNVTVKAYDVDWLQDDYIGSALTDSSGRFIIYYSRADFTKTPFSPFINFEWTGGPDVYFKIETVDTLGNTIVLLDEPPARGRQKDRENISNCFCVHLCTQIIIQDPDEVPMWTHIGKFQIPDSANLHDFTTQGYTNHANGDLAFYSNMTLLGQTGSASATRKLRYRFLYAKWTGMTTPTPTNPVTKDMIAKTQVGVIIQSLSPLVLAPVWVNNPVAAHNHDPDPVTGWIDVENDPMFAATTNQLITLISTKLAPPQGYGNPSPNLDAGNPAPMDVAREVHKFALRYQLEEDTGSGWVNIHDQTLDALIINNANTLLWLELDEFVSGAVNLCKPITNTVTAKYTVDHPHLDWYRVVIEKQGTNQATPVPTQNYGGSLSFRGGNGSAATNVAAWDACSYLVILSAHRRLTNGYAGPSNEWVYRTFCKS